jgi:hypothetical protein
MTQCMGDRRLLLLYYGGGTRAQRTHLQECKACAARYRQLERDLEAISQVLREKPLPPTISHRFRPFTFRWLPGAAVLALALALVWVGARISNPSAWLRLKGSSNEKTWSLVDFPSNIFLLNEAMGGERWIGAGSYDLAAAVLEADRPCEWYDLPAMATTDSSIEDLEISGTPPFAICVEVEVNPVTSK